MDYNHYWRYNLSLVMGGFAVWNCGFHGRRTLNLEMSARTWLMERIIVAGSFPLWDCCSWKYLKKSFSSPLSLILIICVICAMSRCFPFPPPGYEKKPTTDDLDLLKKVSWPIQFSNLFEIAYILIKDCFPWCLQACCIMCLSVKC